MLEQNITIWQLSPFGEFEQLHSVMESRDLGNPDTVLIHVDTNDLRSRNLDYVMDKVYSLVATANSKFP